MLTLHLRFLGRMTCDRQTNRWSMFGCVTRCEEFRGNFFIFACIRVSLPESFAERPARTMQSGYSPKGDSLVLQRRERTVSAAEVN